MRLPLLPAISSRSAAQNKGAKTANVVSDKNNEIMQKRPALVFSEGYGGLGSGLIDSPNGLMSTWDGAIVDEVGCARIVGSGTVVTVPIPGYNRIIITGMSDDGSVCCGWGIKTSGGATRALQITADGITELAYPSGITGKTWAFGISGDGQTIVGRGMQSSTTATSYKWKDGVVTEIARTDAATASEEGGAMGASFDGRYICGWQIRSSVRRGFVHDSVTGVTEYKTLPSPYSASTEVKFLCISSDGAWVGGNALEYPIIWNHQRDILQDISNGTAGFVTGVSQEGKWACGFPSLTDSQSFLFKRERFEYDTATEWQEYKPYAIGERAINDSDKVYTCVTSGVSGATGPTGTGSSISDGTVVWNYTAAAEDVVSVSAKTNFTLGATTTALAISRFGNAIICEVVTAGGDLRWYRWNQCNGTFKNSENLSITSVGAGDIIGRAFPKGAGCSGMAGNIGVTSVSGVELVGKIRVLDQ